MCESTCFKIRIKAIYNKFSHASVLFNSIYVIGKFPSCVEFNISILLDILTLCQNRNGTAPKIRLDMQYDVDCT